MQRYDPASGANRGEKLPDQPVLRQAVLAGCQPVASYAHIDCRGVD